MKMKELKEYRDRNWTFSKLRIANVMARFFRNLFLIKCPSCKQKGVRYIGDDWIGDVWISVYECKECKKEFV